MNKSIPKPCANRLLSVSGIAVFCLSAILAVGCVEGRKSHHELEHEVPAHWPQSLADAADKIETRLGIIESTGAGVEQARSELIEIVGWLPEVAADSSLREPDWNEVNTACTRLERVMKKSIDDQAVEELRKLCEQLRKSPT